MNFPAVFVFATIGLFNGVAPVPTAPVATLEASNTDVQNALIEIQVAMGQTHEEAAENVGLLTPDDLRMLANHPDMLRVGGQFEDEDVNFFFWTMAIYVGASLVLIGGLVLIL